MILGKLLTTYLTGGFLANCGDTVSEVLNWVEDFLGDRFQYVRGGSKSLHLVKHNTKHVYNMTVNNVSTPLGITECEKDLGIYVDSNLNFNRHMKTVLKKAKTVCYLVNITFL